MHAHAQHIAQQRGFGRRLAHHVANAANILVKEDLFAQAIHAARVGEKLEIASARLGIGKLLVEIRGKILRIVAQIKHSGVFVEATPLRIKSHQVEIVGYLAPAAANDPAHDLRHGDDGRAHVELIALLAQHIHLAAEMTVALDDDHLMAFAIATKLRGQFSSCCEAGKTSADDDCGALHR